MSLRHGELGTSYLDEGVLYLLNIKWEVYKPVETKLTIWLKGTRSHHIDNCWVTLQLDWTILDILLCPIIEICAANLSVQVDQGWHVVQRVLKPFGRWARHKCNGHITFDWNYKSFNAHRTIWYHLIRLTKYAISISWKSLTCRSSSSCSPVTQPSE